jgi:pantetheine-phosphate adenylyltransferase
MKAAKRVIVPGSYDPVTLGHLDIIRRAAEEYDEVFAVIFKNPSKEYLFPLSDRVRMLILATDELENVIVSYSDGYVVDYMRDHGIEKIVKGYRTDADLEYERAQADYNMKMGGYPTELLKAEDSLIGISSTLAREKMNEGAELSEILPQKVIDFLSNR